MARVGVLELLPPIPAGDADIKLAIEDARTDGAVASDGGVVPTLAGGAWDAVAVQVGGDALRPPCGDIFAEDAPNHLGLLLDDLAFAPDRFPACVELVDDTISIGTATSDLARLAATPDASMGLDGEVLEEQSVHGAFQADMKLADLTLGQRDDGHAGELQVLEECGDVGLVAADAVQRFGEHHIEAACLCVGQEGLNARTNEGRAGNGTVGIALHLGPTLPLPALAQLVLDRGVTLVVGGIKGVKGDTYLRVSSC